MISITGLLISVRPKQWIKNLFIFAPLLFSKQILDASSVLKAVFGFIIFCVAAGAIYLFNDVKDREEDQRHTLKKLRPIASGQMSVGAAVCKAVGLGILALAFAFILNPNFFCVVGGYVVLQILYNLILKHVVILDVFSVAAGFFARVVGGTFAIDAEISYWLIICTILLSLFLSLAKRRHEQVVLGEDAGNHRKILSEYSPYLLDQMIGVVTATTLISYILYTVSSDTVVKFGTHGLVGTVPFVLYGIFRYLYLIHQKRLGGNPETLFLTDKPLLVNMILWGLASFLIIYAVK